MAEAFVKTFKRDYVRVALIPDAAAALALVNSWMEDYNIVHRINRWARHKMAEQNDSVRRFYKNGPP
jgi:hypothetical protein